MSDFKYQSRQGIEEMIREAIERNGMTRAEIEAEVEHVLDLIDNEAGGENDER